MTISDFFEFEIWDFGFGTFNFGLKSGLKILVRFKSRRDEMIIEITYSNTKKPERVKFNQIWVFHAVIYQPVR